MDQPPESISPESLSPASLAPESSSLALLVCSMAESEVLAPDSLSPEVVLAPDSLAPESPSLAPLVCSMAESEVLAPDSLSPEVVLVPDSLSPEVVLVPDSLSLEDDSMAESELLFVRDSYEGNTEVPDSQIAEEPDAIDAARALELFPSAFHMEQTINEGNNLMHPVCFPHWFGDHGEDVHGAALALLWMSRGYHNFNVDNGVDAMPVDDEQKEKIEEVKTSMFKIVFPFMFEN